MAIVSDDVADAYYAALKTSLSWTPSPADDAKAKAAYRAAWSAALAVIISEAEVLPGTFSNGGGPVTGTGELS